MTTYIIGHRKPDTDSVVAPIALEYLFKQSQLWESQATNPKAVIADPLNPETKYIFQKFQVTTPKLISANDVGSQDKVVLVDHNEQSQTLSGLNPEHIIGIIDHHKIKLNTLKVIYMNVKPWGSTSSIIYSLMKQHQVTPDKKLAGIMLTAILSDTIGFKSPTTTSKDKQLATQLASLADINDLKVLTLAIFKAKSDVAKLSDQAMAKNDYKIYDFTQKVFINQIETVEQDQIIARKSGLLKAMDKIKHQENLPLIFVVVTDLLKINSKIIVPTGVETKIAERAFGKKVTANIIDIGPKISRKIDISPAIETALQTS